MGRDDAHLQREADAQLNRSLSLTSWQMKLEDDMKLWLLHAVAACHTEGPQDTGGDCLLLMEHLRDACRVQGLCSLGRPLWLVSPGNNGKPGAASLCRTTYVCFHRGALGDTCAFSMDSNRSHCEKISRNNGLFRLQQLSSSGEKSTAPQSTKQGLPPSGPFCLLPLCASTFHSSWLYFLSSRRKPCLADLFNTAQVIPLSTVTPVSFIFLKMIYFCLYFFNWSWFIMLHQFQMYSQMILLYRKLFFFKLFF